MIYALYHHPSETVGLIGDSIKKLDLPFRELHLYKGDGLPRETGDLEGLIIMGGPMGVEDYGKFPFLIDELRLIEKVVADHKPVLGICLGSQLLAKALGARVFSNKERELGWYPIKLTPKALKDPFFGLLPPSLKVLHWHGDTFDLPKGAVHLAQSSKCVNQAFRWGEHCYGIQFHLEATPSMVEEWCEYPGARDYIKAAQQDTKSLLRETPQAFSHLKPLAEDFFSRYLKTAYSRILAN